MPRLPNPAETNRKLPTPAGPAGALSISQVSPRSADTSIGDVISGIGDEAYKFMMREKARMDDVAVDDAKNQYLTQALKLEGEFTQIRGKNAVDQDIVADYTTKLDGINETIVPNFKNDTQRRAWDNYYGKSKVQFTAGVMKHKLSESDRYASDTYKATNMTRVQNAHSNWTNDNAVNNSAADIVKNIAKERLRAGWDDERTEAEMMNTLGPLWSGVAAQFINAKQYDKAKALLNEHKDVIGVDKYTSYHKSIEASQTIDLSQEKASTILGTVVGDEAQRKAARDIGGPLGDATLERVKTFQTETRLQIQETKRIQTENDIKWVTDIGAEALDTNTLTVDQVKAAGMSDENTALWMTKVFAQGEKKDKEKVAEDSNDMYAEWLERVSLNPHKYTAEDIAKDINPNGGGLTGPQYRVIAADLIAYQTNKPKTTASAASTKLKALLKSLYDRGDFGVVGTGKKAKKTEAWKTYSNILIDFQRKTIEEPTKDHTDWLNNRVEEEGMKSLYNKLDADWTWGPFKDESNDTISAWLRERGKAVNQKNIDAVKKRYNKR